ncbi:hypothetical protein HAX54_009949 [Datura stramonium]|uniref:Uncharacterized protein n=1 Tax=Datura stramonium TaxID=4076 RepID=A0ABS8TFI4_DATST|nr:hypothetical protein [Datura stramonium]
MSIATWKNRTSFTYFFFLEFIFNFVVKIAAAGLARKLDFSLDWNVFWNVTVEVPQRTSPAAPKTAKLSSGSDAPTRTPKERSPKVVVRRSPRSPALEVKKKLKYLRSSNVTKVLIARICITRKKPPTRFLTWKLSFLNFKELRRSWTEWLILGNQARHAESAYAEIQSLRVETNGNPYIGPRKLRNQLNDSKESEASALEEVSKARMQLEVAKMTEDNLRSEGHKQWRLADPCRWS